MRLRREHLIRRIFTKHSTVSCLEFAATFSLLFPRQSTIIISASEELIKYDEHFPRNIAWKTLCLLSWFLEKEISRNVTDAAV